MRMGGVGRGRLAALCVAAVVVIAAVTLAGVGISRQGGTPEELLELGERYLLELDYEKALAQFLRVIEVEPMQPRGYTGAAEAYWGLGQYEQAIAVLEAGLLAVDSADIARMLEELRPLSAEGLQEDTQDGAEDTHLQRLLSQGAGGANTIDYEDLTLYGHPIASLDRGSMQNILAGNGFAIELSEDENGLYLWASQEERWYLGPQIGGMQPHDADYLTHWTYYHFLSDKEYAPLAIGALQTFDTPEAFFGRWGFSNAAEIGTELRSLGARAYATFDEIEQVTFAGEGWSERVDGWSISHSNLGCSETENGGQKFTSIGFTFSHVDHKDIKFIFGFESDWSEQSITELEEFYLTSVTIYFR